MKWDKYQIDLLRKVWYDFNKKDILNLFANRTWKSIQRKSEELGLTRFRAVPVECEVIPSWLIGEILGDGYIGIGGKYAHTTKHRAYAEFLKAKFEKLGVHANIYDDHRFDSRTNKYYDRTFVATRCNFKQLRLKWYPNGKKVVPDDIVIDDEIFCHWIIGDGTIQGDHSTFRICTMGFLENCVRKLIFKLNDYGIIASIQKDNGIYIRKTEGNKLKIETSIKDFVVPECYVYKFNEIKKWLK